MKVNEVTGITEEQFEQLAEKKDACYHKVKSRYKVWPSAYASGALVQCRKKGAKNWGNKSKKKQHVFSINSCMKLFEVYNTPMNQTEFINELRKTIKIKDLDPDVVQKAYELFLKNVAMNPAEAYGMARNTMRNMAFEQEEKPTSGNRNIALNLPRGEMKVLKAEEKDKDRNTQQAMNAVKMLVEMIKQGDTIQSAESMKTSDVLIKMLQDAKKERS